MDDIDDMDDIARHLEQDYPLMAGIRLPEDVHGMSLSELTRLADEIRRRLIRHCTHKSAHFASNMGVVELTIALHHVFDFTKDRLVLDVGHQVYPHKMLTPRPKAFETIRSAKGLSGYPDPRESEFDLFHTGHASMAISTALGIAQGMKADGRDAVCVAVVGDGSLTGGAAYEGLNNASTFDAPFIVILNDNKQSISPSVGGLNTHLSGLRESRLYNRIRYGIADFLEKMPLVGPWMRSTAGGALDAIRRFLTPDEIFSALGFRYFGPIDGHDIKGLVKHLKRVRHVKRPVLLHVYTQKGRGFKPAEDDPERFHSPLPSDMAAMQGTCPVPMSDPAKPTWSKVVSKVLVDMAFDDSRICAVTAAMPGGTGADRFQKAFPDRFFDVGIAEQHAVAFSAGLAKSGKRPCLMIYSTFLQRAFDQCFQEISLQGDMPVVFAIDRAGVVGDDGPTHHGVFDIAYLRVFPNFILMAPKDEWEAREMLRFAMSQSKPCAIRYPRDAVPVFEGDYPHRPIFIGKGEILIQGEHAAILAYGAMVRHAVDAAELLEEDGIRITVANARFAKPVDTDLAKRLLADHPVVLTAEDHQAAGGFGSAVREAMATLRVDTSGLYTAGIDDRYVEHDTREHQLKMLHLDAAGLAMRVKAILSGTPGESVRERSDPQQYNDSRLS